jgi:small-conductance mechanosensitive channel
VEVLGVKLIGIDSETGTKLLLTLAVVGVAALIRVAAVAVVAAIRHRRNDRVTFWTRQGTSLAAAIVMLGGFLSIWFDDPRSLGMAGGLVTAGLAIAAQRAVTAFFGYLIIMRGNTFTVGDRIKMGGVQGDVIALGFLQTRILEMGQPPDVNEQDAPGMWVRARQYSGRVVTVTNDKIFDEAVYNFTREFPFIWEEITVPIPYKGNHAIAERILLDAARDATTEFVRSSGPARAAFQRRYNVALDTGEPRVYCRLTDNWIEFTVRFVVSEHGIRDVKDQMSRRILREFESAGVEIASGTYEIVGVPPIRIQHEAPAGS